MHLKKLEMELLSNSTRKNAGSVASLLAEQFREYGSSGRVYTRQEVVAVLQEAAPVSLSLVDFEMRLLAPTVALVTYRSLKEEAGKQEAGLASIAALRSSIWVLEDEQWRMIFHQGTGVPAPAGV